jgi:hypothetical protein
VAPLATTWPFFRFHQENPGLSPDAASVSLSSNGPSTALRFQGIQEFDRLAWSLSVALLRDAAEESLLAVALPAVLPEDSLAASGSATFRFQGIQLRPFDGSDSTGSAAAFPFSVDEFLDASDEADLLAEPSPVVGAGAAGVLPAAFALEAVAGEPPEEVAGALCLMESLGDSDAPLAAGDGEAALPTATSSCSSSSSKVSSAFGGGSPTRITHCTQPGTWIGSLSSSSCPSSSDWSKPDFFRPIGLR